MFTTLLPDIYNFATRYLLNLYDIYDIYIIYCISIVFLPNLYWIPMVSMTSMTSIASTRISRVCWCKFADLAGIPEDDRLKLSNGWLGRFKERNGLREMRQHGEAGSSTAGTVERERERIKDISKKWDLLTDAYVYLKRLNNTSKHC